MPYLAEKYFREAYPELLGMFNGILNNQPKKWKEPHCGESGSFHFIVPYLWLGCSFLTIMINFL